MAPAEVDSLWTPEDLSDFLQKSTRTLKAWRGSEYGVKGPRWIRVGGEIRYWRSDVMRWLETQEMDSDVR